MNIRAAFIHVIGDLIQSVGVLIAAIIIWVNPSLQIADPICTFLFSILVIGTTWMLVRDVVHVLMEGVPGHIDIDLVQHDLMSVKGVLKIHNLHIWSISSGRVALNVHVVAKDDIMPHSLLEKCRAVAEKYGIQHSTIQVENSDCRTHSNHSH